MAQNLDEDLFYYDQDNHKNVLNAAHYNLVPKVLPENDAFGSADAKVKT